MEGGFFLGVGFVELDNLGAGALFLSLFSFFLICFSFLLCFIPL